MTNPRRPALLFDLDGTLIMSDPIHEEVFRALWAEFGLTVEDDHYEKRIHGRANLEIFADFLPDHPDPVALGDRKEAMFRDRLPKPYPSVPGAPALIERAAKSGWGVAVVTNAMQANAEASLGAIGLRDAFKIVISGEECERAKPDPMPYQEAMRRLNVQPDACIAFEDSPSGIKAARAAGAFTIGVRTALTDEQLRAAGAQATIQDFTDPALQAHLDRLNGVIA